MNQLQQSICLYDNTKKSEIDIIKHKIKNDEDLIQKIDKILPIITNKKRTSSEFRGILSIKNMQIYCNKNLIKKIEEIPNCI